MNIQASYNWIKEFVATDLDAREFAKRIALCGPGAERLYPQAPLFDKMVVGRIVEVKAHPNPKVTKLRIVALDLGAQGSLELVCGGSNLEPEMLVAVALVGSKVRWHGEGDLIELAEAEIQGVKSAGMVCGANEIGLGEVFPHAEKEILDLSWTKAKPGTSIAEALQLEDTVIDIEVTTNRPDAFSMVGLAREAAAILDAKFIWKPSKEPGKPKGDRKDVSFDNRSPELCTRYQAVVMSLSHPVGESPWHIKNRLRMAGIRPINALVDITNYVMLELGQPMHAFDYDKLRGNGIVIRMAADGEKLLALDGKEYELSSGQLIIADAERPIAVAGIMGGEETGVTASTTTVVFESATFDAVSVRRTGRALNLHSDSSLRFEKGLPEEQTAFALARAVELAQEICGAEVVSEGIDDHATGRAPLRFPFRTAKAEEIIGVTIPEKRMVAILEALGFTLEGKKGAYEVTVPFWRANDIEDERDFAEEIARIYGYHNLPAVLPTGTLPAVAPDPLFEAEGRVRSMLKGAGFTELMTYAFVARETLEKSLRMGDEVLAVANPLSKDFEVMRNCLVPGVLTAVAENEGLFPEGECFEIGNAYKKRTDGLPEEQPRMIAVAYGPEDGDRYFRKLKGVLETYAAGEGMHGLVYRRVTDDAKWHPGRTVEVSFGGTVLGKLGEVHPDIVSAFGIRSRVVVCQLLLANVLAAGRRSHVYAPVPQFPSIFRDLAVVVDMGTEYGRIEEAARSASPLLTDVTLFDVYHGTGLPEGKKSVAVHLAFSASDRTLRSEDVDVEMTKVTAELAAVVGATVRG